MLRNAIDSLFYVKILQYPFSTVCSVRFHPRHRSYKDETDILSENEMFQYTENIEENTHPIERERARLAQRKWLKNKIIHKKASKREPEVNLLSWAAKEQIRLLHDSQPLKWHIQKLANSFPISEEGVKAVLKANYLKTDNEIVKHDERVRRNWLTVKKYLNNSDYRLSEEGGPLDYAMTKLLADDKILLMLNAGGLENVNLPEPVTQVKREGNARIGLFESIVKGYVDKENTKNSKSKTGALTNIHSRSIFSGISQNGRTVNKIQLNVAKDTTLDSMDPNSYSVVEPARKPHSRRKEVLLNHNDLDPIEDLGIVDTGLVEDLKSPDSSFSECSSDSFNDDEVNVHERSKSVDCGDQFRENNQKILSKMKFDTSTHGDKVAYMFDYSSGYDYPLGKPDEKLKKLKATRMDGKKNTMYKKDNYIYDSDGEFLYKIP